MLRQEPEQGREYETRIERMSYGSMAVARVQEAGGEKPMVVFVEGGAPGDVAKIRLTHRHKNYWEAELVEILEPSPDRTSPPCRHFGRCGGCQWQHLRYEAQVAAKKEILLHQLQRATKIPASRLAELLSAHPAEAPFGYRSRVQARGDASGLGFFAKRSKRLVHIDSCAVLRPELDARWKSFKPPQTAPFKVEWTLTESGEVLEAINKPHAALGFTQINEAGNAKLRAIVEKLAAQSPRKDLLWDLYGGDGNLVRNLRKEFAKTVTVDIARDGDRKAGSASHVFKDADVGAFLKTLPPHESKPDCILADPPRAGLEGCAEPLAKIAARQVILVSCDPSTLARDLTRFLKSYAIRAIHLIDLFPQTFHFETVLDLTCSVISE